MRFKPKVLTVMIYSFTLTGAAFMVDTIPGLLALALPPLVLATLLGRGKMLWLVLAYLIGCVGVFINSLMFANTGQEVVSTGLLTIRSNAVYAFAVVSLKLLAISCAGGVFIFSFSSTEIYRGLLYEVGLPILVTLPLAYSLRMLPIIRRDLAEVIFQRRQKGYRTILLYPPHVASVVATLLSINYERARWSGISAELRGFRRVKPRRSYRVAAIDLLFYMLLAAQLLLILAHR